jgi:hypothetical protein
VFCVHTFAQKNAAQVNHTATPIKVDGFVEQIWDDVAWQPISYLMASSRPQSEDFSGRYKLWDDDCLEVFIDSDASSGNHRYNHSAFAYHIAFDNQAVDSGEEQKAHLHNHYVTNRWQRNLKQHKRIIWEVAIKLFPNNYSDDRPLLHHFKA